jgi:hypothetical protein
MNPLNAYEYKAQSTTFFTSEGPDALYRGSYW